MFPRSCLREENICMGDDLKSIEIWRKIEIFLIGVASEKVY